jgi:hypothetical protein
LNMKSLLICIFLLAAGIMVGQEESAKTTPTVDIIWLKDGSKLKGTILQWDLERGMEFKLITGATIYINKADIDRVIQEEPAETRNERVRYFNEPKPYSFREEGWYHNSSGFFNISINGGAGIHHVMGWRFNRMFGIGLGTGIETHDFNWVRNIIPIYAEARGFFLPKKITPYYALKLGYGIALNDRANGTVNARGGIHFSPELGVRFGGGDVSYYLGLEYKLQNASFTNEWWGGGASTDRVSYRRIEMRTGLLF